jgi:hypothetical protein
MALLVGAGCERPNGNARSRADQATDLTTVASAFDLPEYPKQGRLPPMGDTKCVLRRVHDVAVGQTKFTFVGVMATRSADCVGYSAIQLTLWQTSGGAQAGTRIQVSGDAEDFGYLAPAYCKADCGPSFNDSVRKRAAIAGDRFLRQLVDIDPVSSSDLPPWSHDALQPELHGAATFEPLTDPTTYEAVRAARATVLCWQPTGEDLKCVASTPRRTPAQLDLFIVHGLGDEAPSVHSLPAEGGTRRAVAALLGKP